jgi:hypothetical protein
MLFFQCKLYSIKNSPISPNKWLNNILLCLEDENAIENVYQNYEIYFSYISSHHLTNPFNNFENLKKNVCVLSGTNFNIFSPPNLVPKFKYINLMLLKNEDKIEIFETPLSPTPISPTPIIPNKRKRSVDSYLGERNKKNSEIKKNSLPSLEIGNSIKLPTKTKKRTKTKAKTKARTKTKTKTKTKAKKTKSLVKTKKIEEKKIKKRKYNDLVDEVEENELNDDDEDIDSLEEKNEKLYLDLNLKGKNVILNLPKIEKNEKLVNAVKVENKKKSRSRKKKSKKIESEIIKESKNEDIFEKEKNIQNSTNLFSNYYDMLFGNEE